MMNTEAPAVANEARIRELVNSWVHAIREKDVDAVMRFYASQMTAFDAVPPLRISLEEYRHNWEQCFAFTKGELSFEVRDLTVFAGDDVAFAHCLTNIRGMGGDGESHDFWARTTLCFRKLDGEWRIAHTHDSAPFDCETGNALMDLKP
ncbi:SgcJ/EcaC family oxidoreductase [Phycisphaerales bacterium AB-hyl4]|uniref:SgcJ/EcaC family oxidoreductase n=1 Tax=Natronomicrosphaera hydrolytica TaxID=3242702 RepID=A0ABV4UA96_9BACT